MKLRRKPVSGLHEPLRGEINVTPLVDVCLVLLIICMVVVPTISKGSGHTARCNARPPLP